MMNFLNGLFPILQAILILAALVGGVFVFRNSKKTGIVQIQSETILAMQHQIDALKAGQDTLQKENDRYGYVLETIAEALKQKGILITINGEMVTLVDTSGQVSSIRRPTRPAAATKKAEPSS